MRRITIGIPVYAEPARLQATLASIQAHTSGAYELLLLPDGPDEETQAALATLPEMAQSGTVAPLGMAACFNRLIRVSTAEVLVLLESGSQVGPDWLIHLLAAFDADPHNGLAGPSTNSVWNEQCVFPRRGGAPDEIARTAREAAQRFAGTSRTLEPLYSLADFCYVVRREVVDAIGAADESYGLGPCWEMDYNIRAARAGWHGVWACAAYVHRASFTARRRREEALHFADSKRRYQDKFCGARLRGEQAGYHAHCRGDACTNFAPPAWIPIYHPLPELDSNAELPTGGQKPNASERQRASAPGPESSALEQEAKNSYSPGTPATIGAALCSRPQGDNYLGLPLPRADGARTNLAAFDLEINAPKEPLVTCIMPTYNRRSFVPQALRCFLRQDYHNLELLIVDDGTESIADCIPAHEHIRYVRLGQKFTIGAKRNLACRLARGEIIVHWDDDDWYPPWRVRRQVRALLDHSAGLCGSSRIFYYDSHSERAWEYQYAAPGRPWVAGNTLAYRKSFWERCQFPDVQIGEDSRFVWSSAGNGRTLVDLAEPALCVATVHAGNTSRKETSGAFWRSQPTTLIQALLGDDYYFYRAPSPHSVSATWPLVSCIMPTCDRRSFIPLALRQFHAQDYPHKELVVIDDGEDAIEELVRHAPGVRYLRLGQRTSIGAKRNLACQHARGEIIAHWDDDDWYAPDRLRYQVVPILADVADITGLDNAFTLTLPERVFWRAEPDLHQRMFIGNVHGGTLVYSRSLLTGGVRYPEVNLAEDAWLLQQALRRGKRLRRLANPGVFVYVRHGRNAWRECTPGRFLDPARWVRISAPPLFPADALNSFTRAACGEVRQSD